MDTSTFFFKLIPASSGSSLEEKATFTKKKENPRLSDRGAVLKGKSENADLG